MSENEKIPIEKLMELVESGLTQKEIAEQIGRSQSSVSERIGRYRERQVVRRVDAADTERINEIGKEIRKTMNTAGQWLRELGVSFEKGNKK